MKRKTKMTALAMGVILISSCTDATRSKIAGYGDEFKVEMYSGGELVREWTSSGRVESELHTDGYYFRCKDTGRLIQVSGDIVITKL